MTVNIVQKDSEVLRQKAELVSASDIGSPKLNKILTDMSSALASCDDGVALACPQIGISLRIFVVSKKLFTPEAGETEKDVTDVVFINPEITKMSKRKVEMDEGCLSVRHIYGKTKRSTKATVTAYDEFGNKFSWSGSGLMAQIFQHEIDHLDGILFTDHATSLRNEK